LPEAGTPDESKSNGDGPGNPEEAGPAEQGEARGEQPPPRGVRRRIRLIEHGK
jgi:hypothetical protein